MPTIKDVARAARVSVGTVSNYLNGTTQVADAKAERIREAIDALGYHVHLGARGLRVGATRTVGLVVPNISNPFFGEIARELEHALTARGYQTFLCDSSDDSDRERAYLENLANRRVDGAFVIHAHDDGEPVRRYEEAAVPIVFVDRPVPGRPSVASDNYLGGRLVAEHVLELGHERIAVMLGRPEVSNVAARFAGLRDALMENGLDVPDAYVLKGRQTLEFGRDVDRLMALPAPPTAIFTTNDIVAVGAWLTLTEHGYRIPDDVSLIGFDDIELSRSIRPSLTTVAQDLPELARHAVDMLLDQIEPEAGSKPRSTAVIETVPIEPRLVVRASTAPVPRAEARPRKAG